MNLGFKWAALGAMLGFSAAVGVSCGPANKCTTSTCPFGCCDSAGTCQPGSSSSLCGSQGQACQACGFGQLCQLNQCLAGGSAGTGGGSSNAGGGTGTGGGASNTGGGTGGGSGSDFCARLVGATTQWHAGRTVCESPTAGTVTLDPNALSKCTASVGACTSASDQATLNQWVSCIGGAPRCTAGNETAAVQGFNDCLSPLLGGLSTTCINALSSSSTGGGGGTNTGGGTGGGGPPAGGGGGSATGGGGGTTTCMTMPGITAAFTSGKYASGTYEGTFASGYASTTFPTASVNMEVIWTINGTATNVPVPGTLDLATEARTYNTCRYCLWMSLNCADDSQTSCPGGDFLATAGTVTVSSAPRMAASGTSLVGSGASVRFEQWNLSGDTKVPGGSCFIVPTVSISAPIQ